MENEIRAHVNSFLGGPVVRHIRIECIREITRGDRSQRPLDSLAVPEPGDWPRRRSTFGGVEPIGRSRVKYVARKHGKVG
jgi:hypothetical protein